MEKREFMKTGTLLGLGGLLAFSPLMKLLDSVKGESSEALAKDDEFWNTIRGGYLLKPDYINLENGYYCIQPQVVLDAYLNHIREINLQGAYYMRTVQAENKKAMAAKLAALAGCEPDELIITRNTTESLDTVISGMHYQPGDEAVMAQQDYGAMLDMFAQVAERYGVVNKIISIPNHPASDEEIVNLYAAAITPATKLLMVCHMINITGQILPVRKICDMAHERGVKVMVDGAHALAHLQFRIADLNCDFYGASLHKWLSVPLGAGMLYVKRSNVPLLWPLLAESGKSPDDLSRLNHTGTHPVATDLAIADAIDFYHLIGAERKEARLRFLQQYWTSKARKNPRLVVNTPAEPHRACAIANVGVKDLAPADLATRLLKEYHIYTVAIDGKGVRGCRITPNVFTTTAELDALVKALNEIAG